MTFPRAQRPQTCGQPKKEERLGDFGKGQKVEHGEECQPRCGDTQDAPKHDEGVAKEEKQRDKGDDELQGAHERFKRCLA